MAGLAAASAVPEVMKTLSDEPGGISGTFNNIMVKPVYMIFFVLLLIGIIVITAGKYKEGFILTIFSSLILGGMFYFRTVYAEPRRRMKGGAESKMDLMLRLKNSLFLSACDDCSEQRLLKSLQKDKDKIRISYNELEDSQKTEIYNLINSIGDQTLIDAIR